LSPQTAWTVERFSIPLLFNFVLILAQNIRSVNKKINKMPENIKVKKKLKNIKKSI